MLNANPTHSITELINPANGIVAIPNMDPIISQNELNKNVVKILILKLSLSSNQSNKS